MTLGHQEHLGDVVAGYGTGVDLGVIRAWWSLRSPRIHWPVPVRDLYVQTWQILEKIHAEGMARSIGFSNFAEDHLSRLIRETEVVPAVNQVTR